jgi:hypothetical protein
MKDIDFASYLKLAAGMFIPMMLAWFYFRLDHSAFEATMIYLVVYSAIIILGVLMFNYLETGNLFKVAKKFDKQNPYNKYDKL